MPFLSFDHHFPEQARAETRSLTLFEDGRPRRSYLFVELYCDEPGCDCRRVIVQVFSNEPGVEQPRARLSWGWELEAFYRKWASFPLTREDLEELKGPGLVRLVPQSSEADVLLEHFRTLLASPEYAARIVRHYEAFRDVIESGPAASAEPPSNRAERRMAKSQQRRRVGRR